MWAWPLGHPQRPQQTDLGRECASGAAVLPSGASICLRIPSLLSEARSSPCCFQAPWLLDPSAAEMRACPCTEPPWNGTGGLAPLGSGRRRAAVTALAYKYLRGGSGFRQSTSVVKIKVFDLLSIYSVKYDLPGPFFPQMSSTPFFLVEVTTFSPKAEQRRCKSLAHTNANQKIPFPATEARRRQQLGDRGCGISEPEDSGWHLGRLRKVFVGSVRGPGGGGPEPMLGGSPCGQAGLTRPPQLLGGRESVWSFRGLRGWRCGRTGK